MDSNGLRFATLLRGIQWLAAALLTGSLVFAQTNFIEQEPNETKATATPADCMLAMDFLTGCESPGGESRDMFRVRTCPTWLRIYEHRLASVAAGSLDEVAPSIQGRSQAGGVIDPTSDVPVQEALPATGLERFVQWYGFGKGEEVYYDLGVAAFTRVCYESTLETRSVAPTTIPGTFAPGLIAITTAGQGHATNTDLWLYDAGLSALPTYGNDDVLAGSLTQASLARNLATGTYYLAISDSNLANSEPAAADDATRNANVLDFQGAVVCSSEASGVDLTFTISDNSSAVQIPATKGGPFAVEWFQFTVGDGSAVFAPYCFGDGGGTACPCGGTSSAGAGQGCPNSGGQGGVLLAIGTENALADDLALHVSNLPPAQSAILFAGVAPVASGDGTVFGDGLLCVGGAIARLGVEFADGVGSASWGPGLAGLGGWGAGDVRRFQVWYRDPGADCAGLPGAGSNLTNAIEVAFAP